VDRFIQYDVGRLPGDAGVQARQDFQQLGPEAIPALVRGLNKAAALRASCPIALIASRLMSLLGQSQDPGMIRYALDNIGRGVKPTDPHTGRFKARPPFGVVFSAWLGRRPRLPVAAASGGCLRPAEPSEAPGIPRPVVRALVVPRAGGPASRQVPGAERDRVPSNPPALTTDRSSSPRSLLATRWVDNATLFCATFAQPPEP
jgi:hypothetical protein